MTTFKLEETETQFQNRVMEYATMRGWKWLHINKAQNSAGYWRTPVMGELGLGWPDLFLVRGSRMIAAELKSGKKYLTRKQEDVLGWLTATGYVESYVWHPDEWETVMEVLK